MVFFTVGILIYLIFLYRFLLTKTCRRKCILQYFGEEITADVCCKSLGGATCDNCERLQTDGVQLVSRIQEFSIIADAISDLPNHGIKKVSSTKKFNTNIYIYISHQCMTM